TRDADLLADLEAIGIDPWGGGERLVDGHAEPLGQAEEGIPLPDGVEGPALASRGGHTRDADALAALEAIGIDRRGGGEGLGEEGRAFASRAGHTRDADLLADLEAIGIHPWVGGDQLVDGDAEPLGQAEEGIPLPDGVEGPALAGRGGYTRDADALADLEAIG